MKFPFDFGLSLIFRLVFPGVVVATASLPFALALLKFLGVNGLGPNVVLPILAVIFGWFFVLCDQQIYMIMEGRCFWPAWLKSLFVDWEKRRLTGIQEKYELLKNENKERAGEINLKKLSFPLDEKGNYQATCPTRLGNLLASYETYTNNVYRLDSIFYWPRIWLLLDESKRKALDEAQALADSAVYVCFALYVSAFILFLYALGGWIWDFWPWHKMVLFYLPGPWQTLGLAVFPVLSGYAVYRLGMYAQEAYGSLFRAQFDLHLTDLDGWVYKVFKQVVAIAGSQRDEATDKYKIVSRYLRWNKVWPEGAPQSIRVESLPPKK